MKRIIMLILKKIYIAPFWFIKICRYANSSKHTRREKYELLHNIVKKINKSANVDIDIIGKENLPKENGYVMFPNHQGLFDALIMLELMDEPFTFVIKKELEDNFFIKRIIKLIGAQTIDRNDIRQSLNVINQMTREVESGINYVIFAEGTRSKDKNNIQKFKGGSFKSATKAKAPIVPIAIVDSYKVFDNNSISHANVKVSILDPIYYNEYHNLKTTEIASNIENIIQNEIKSLTNK